MLAPTRELATQIQEEAEKFGESAGYACACAYGGAPKRDQLRAIQNANVLVATPGRLLGKPSIKKYYLQKYPLQGGGGVPFLYLLG